MAELENSIDQCITITTEQCPQQTINQTTNKLCNCKTKCVGECVNNEKSIKCFPTNQLSSLLNKNINQLNSSTTTNSIVPFNSNLATNTTTKLQLSIAPHKRHYRHHSASSAMMNCTSSLLLGDQVLTKQPILCNATTNIKLGHHRSISTSTIHHHLYLHHLHSQIVNNSQVTVQQQQQQQQIDKSLAKSKEEELKLDYYKSSKKHESENVLNEDKDSSMDSCSLVSSCASDKKLKDIPSCMYALLTNPVYIVTCLGSCMELCIVSNAYYLIICNYLNLILNVLFFKKKVSGFLVFLPKYLETQFSISKSQANLYSGGIAVPGAVFGIFLGGYLLKYLNLKPKGIS